MVVTERNNFVMCLSFQSPSSEGSLICFEGIVIQKGRAVLLILSLVLDFVVNHDDDGAEDRQACEG